MFFILFSYYPLNAYSALCVEKNTLKCDNLGYTKSTCPYGGIACPFDISRWYCAEWTCQDGRYKDKPGINDDCLEVEYKDMPCLDCVPAICKLGSVYYADGSCGFAQNYDGSKIPVGIVFEADESDKSFLHSNPYKSIVVLCKFSCIEFRIFSRLVEQKRHIHADSVCEGEIPVRFPLVLDIEPELGSPCRCSPPRVPACQGRVGISVVELGDVIVEEIIETVVCISAVGILEEHIVEPEDFIVGADRYIVVSGEYGHIVSNCICVRIHCIGS